MSGRIVAEPLNPQAGFNWVFLVELLICGILTIFFLFYFNRLFATLISYGIRAYTWRTFHAYIDITSLQISPLGGRLFFKDIRYHGHNETILVHGGHITWNYWLGRVRNAAVYAEREPDPTPEDSSDRSSSRSDHVPASHSRSADQAEKGGKQTQKQLPCRITVKLSGLEAFMYNRSPAYDGIIDAVQRKAAHAAEQEKTPSDGNAEKEKTTSSGSSGPHILKKVHSEEPNSVPRTDTTHTSSSSMRKPELPAFLKLLPIQVDITKGAVVVGNEHTLAVITAQFEKASGTLDAGRSGPLDVYQQLFNFQVTHPVVQMKPNPDFKTSQLDAAANYKEESGENIATENTKHTGGDRKRGRRWLRKLPTLSGLFSKSSDSVHTYTKAVSGGDSKSYGNPWHFNGQERWRGLARYLDDSTNDGHGEWDSVEYAKTSLIADIPCVNLSFFWDVTGPVPREIDNSMHIDASRPDDINGSAPPEYGMDIQIFGGIVNYGPWADRHRGIFQNIFFPGSHVDGVPAQPLKAGDARLLTVFKLFLSIEEETVLRIPLREPSKDWKWKGKAQTLAGHGKSSTQKPKGKTRSRKKRGKQREPMAAQSVRPFAWIDVKVSGNTTVNYIMDMYPSEKGFKNKLDVEVPSTEISSSVNHGLLWRSGNISLDCDLSNSISWNTLRTWLFNIKCRDLELFLLRDHLFLIADLVADWGTGPPSDYFLFVPFKYLLNVDFTNFKMYLNTNDSNIVNNPADLDDNNFIVLYGRQLLGDVIIPLDKFRPLQNEIHFDVKGYDLGLEVLMPPKNTIKTFIQSTNVARLSGFTLKGSHTFVTETSPMNTDRLYMDIQGHDLDLELYGWLIHQFMKLKDNYFGEDLHFKTLEEFQGLPSVTHAADGTAPIGQPAKISNDLDVILSIAADQATVLLPSNLYSAERSIRADLPYASADLRFTNYYMDLMVNFSPISVSLGGSYLRPDRPNKLTSGRTELFVDATTIFGHRLFGLPPTEPTYVCNWDFDVGRISGECTSEFLKVAAGAGRAFAFTLDNDENSLPLTDVAVIHDSTFLRLRTHELSIWLHVAQEALLVKTGAISLDFNDLAGTTFSQKLRACIPDIMVTSVDATSPVRRGSRLGGTQVAETHAFLHTTLKVDMLNRKLDFSEDRSKQQEHMKSQDERTNRAKFMLGNESPNMSSSHRDKDGLWPPAMQYPDIPQPVFLFHPGKEGAGSIASSWSSSYGSSARGRQRSVKSSRSISHTSIAQSIRSGARHSNNSKTAESSRSRTLLDDTTGRGHSDSIYHLPSLEGEHNKGTFAPSSVALSSSLSPPHFPMDSIEPDYKDVPRFPEIGPFNEDEELDGPLFNDVSTRKLDENFSHTSILISAEPGIRLYCTPNFIRGVSAFVELVLPQRPEDLLDDFQVKSMTMILDHRNRREGKGTSLEFNIHVPYTHVRFQHDFSSRATIGCAKDQYDVILNQLKTSARVKKLPGDDVGKNSVSLHTTLGSLGLSVTECTQNGPQNDVAVQAEVRDILVWVLQSKETSVNVSFRSLETATASKKVDYLASLIHRTMVLADELASKFKHLDQSQQQRLRYLVWFLTCVQDQHADPAFLTKATYALRAARDHLRNHDSWKIVSRFRSTWQGLPEDEKEQLNDDLSALSMSIPEDAEEQVIQMWDQWRTWDLYNVRESLAMRLLFGRFTKVLHGPSATSLLIDIKSANVNLIIDPGVGQSNFMIEYLALNLALLPPTEPTGLMLVENETPLKRTTVQVNSRSIGLHLRWEICELAEALLDLFKKEGMTSLEAPPKVEQSSPDSQSQAFDHDMQVVLVTEKTQITLDTINLRSLSTGQRLRFAYIDADHRASGLGGTLSAHVHLDVGISELSSRSRSLGKAQFEQPNVYFAMVEHEKGSPVSDEIKVAAASGMISLKVEEDILGFIEVVDGVLRDEVAYFQRQATVVKEMQKKVSVQKKQKLQDPAQQLPIVTLALFMDAYQIEMALLQPLGWSIQGTSGRIAVVPKLGKGVTLQVDYDLDAHLHRLYSKEADNTHVISSFELPPLNGRLSVTQNGSQTRILASGIVETIRFQASEVQALINTVSKPEMTHMFEAIQHDVEVLTTHVREIFPPSADDSVNLPRVPSQEVLFGVQMTLSGMEIVASAPGKTLDSLTATLAFRLSSVQLTATNISKEGAMIFPEAVVLLQEITVNLSLMNANTVRQCGNLTFGAMFQATTDYTSDPPRRVFRVSSSGLEVNIFADTASAVVDVVNHLQDKIKDLDLSKEKKYLRRLRHKKSRIAPRIDRAGKEDNEDEESVVSGALFTSTYALELVDMHISWIVGNSVTTSSGVEMEDLVLSFDKIDLSTHKDDAAHLTIDNMRLQMVPESANKKDRSLNSALLPKMVFNVAYASTKDARQVAFHAAGKSLDLQLDSHFLIPANNIKRSIALAGKKVRKATASWSTTPTTTGAQRKNPFGNKRLGSLTVDTNFAGAVVHINGNDSAQLSSPTRAQQKGRYSQFVGDGSKSSMALRAPGVAIRVEYQDDGAEPYLNGELRVDGSTNTLLPTVVPVIIDISDSIKEVVRDSDSDPAPASPEDSKVITKPAAKLLEEDNIITADPTAILGRTRLNLGVRICKQEFSLSCQPIARVTAIAKIDDVYITFNSVKSQEHGHFFAASAAFEKLSATVQHVYSRESTFSLDVESIVLSLMNSKHLSGTSGISAILKINPTALQINARQLQDFLLFREIWVPPEIRKASEAAAANNTTAEPQEYLIQRYQQVAAATAFPWNANVAIADVKVSLDLGQAIGKASLHIHNMWASSKKSTTWEQNLCIGVEKIGIESTGRTSGGIDLYGIKVRTSIGWPLQDKGPRRTPLIQAAVAFRQLRVKTGFDYQAFVMADIADFSFVMYNARGEGQDAKDRLVAILDGGKVHVFCHATSAAQGLALWQAIERLIQENQQAYKQSLRDIEKFLRRKSSIAPTYGRSPSSSQVLNKVDEEDSFKAPISLHTDVVVTLRSIKLGVFPSTFIDHQLLLLEAGDMQARFAVALEETKIHSSLGMTLGQLSVALSSVSTPKKPKAVTDLTVEDVVESAQSARGGTILRVPKVIARMNTWQVPKNNHIDYLFSSSLEGKVDVGWNYSRISYIRTMWTNHSRTLASRLGKPLPESNIKISASQTLPDPTSGNSTRPRAPSEPGDKHEKITAVVNVPQSKYDYTPLEPPIIETPQLRDMGEATPPLEWIGLHRDRLPNVTHQIVIVTLLELAREVEEAYERILGSS